MIKIIASWVDKVGTGGVLVGSEGANVRPSLKVITKGRNVISPPIKS